MRSARCDGVLLYSVRLTIVPSCECSCFGKCDVESKLGRATSAFWVIGVVEVEPSKAIALSSMPMSRPDESLTALLCRYRPQA
jgi:hypothetical protein